MAYKAPVSETEHALVSEHNKAEIAPSNAWIVTAKSDMDSLSLIKENGATLKDVFRAAAALPDDGLGKFMVFHAVNPDDEVQHTNSKLPTFHLHTFTGPFADEFAHIADPAVKSYTVQPNSNLATLIKAKTEVDATDKRFQTLSLNKDNGGEIASHAILVHRGFSSMDDFANRASDNDWDSLRRNLADLIGPWVEDGQGGTRIVIDDRYTNPGFLTVQVLAGENMDRSGANKQRYFQRPQSPGA